MQRKKHTHVLNKLDSGNYLKSNKGHKIKIFVTVLLKDVSNKTGICS